MNKKEVIMGIYKITNKINNKIYIGKSIDIYGRWRQHINELNDISHVNKGLQRDWIKYGQDNFKFNIEKEINEESELSKTEQYYINMYKANDNKYGYNIGIACSANKKQEKIQDGKIPEIDMLNILDCSKMNRNLNLNENVVKVYYEEIDKKIKQDNLKFKDIVMLFQFIPYIKENSNILCDFNGNCIHKTYLNQILGIDRKTIYSNLKILINHRFIKEIIIHKYKCYIVNPKYIHNGFYTYDNIIKLFEEDNTY